MPRTSSRRDLAAATAVAVAIAFLGVAKAARYRALWNDAIGYLAIANSWVNGAGFVDPVKWTYFLEAKPPVPAFTSSAPLPPLLFAVPLALGGSIATVRVFHAVLASIVVGGLVLLARRFMSLPAAVACGLYVGLSRAWLGVIPMPMTDQIAIGALLLVLATAPGATRSVLGAALCGMATLLAWTTRPTLAVLGGAIVLEALLAAGVRGVLRNGPLRVYLAVALGGYVALYALHVAATGFAPYEAYGFMAQMISPLAPISYTKKYPGALAFLWNALPQILANVSWNVTTLVNALFAMPRFGYVGWIAVPGIVHAWRAPARRDDGLRLVALTCALFIAQTIATYSALDVYRYPLPILVCGALCGFAMLDDALASAGRALASRVRGQHGSLRRAAVALDMRWLALLAVLALFLGLHGDGVVRLALRDWDIVLGRSVARAVKPDRRLDVVGLCRWIRRGALVAARDPWSIHAACGNPAVTLPHDLEKRPQLQPVFLAREAPLYLVYDGSGIGAWLTTSPHLQRTAAHGRYSLYEVREPRDTRIAWRGPPPLLCSGLGEACLQSVRR